MKFVQNDIPKCNFKMQDIIAERTNTGFIRMSKLPVLYIKPPQTPTQIEDQIKASLTAKYTRY